MSKELEDFIEKIKPENFTQKYKLLYKELVGGYKNG